MSTEDRPVGNQPADIESANKGTSGTNITYDQNPRGVVPLRL